MEADDVDLAARVAEERAEPGQDPRVRAFAGGAGLVPVGVGTTRKRCWASGEMWVFHRSLRSWLLVVVPPRSTSAMIPRLGPREETKSGRAWVTNPTLG